MTFGTKYKTNFKIDNPEKTINISPCNILKCAVHCVINGCALFSFSETTCTCELTFGYDTTYRQYSESAASGFTIYKMY